MRTGGYIAVARTIFDHPVFRRRPEWHVAWEKLIASAAWKPMGHRGEWGVVHVERGQVATTLRRLGTAWGWPKSNVDRFLKRLQREEMVHLQTTGTATGTSSRTLPFKVTIITICNYDKFQRDILRDKKAGQEAGQEAGQALQQPLPLSGLPPPEPTNHLTNSKSEEVDKIGEGQESVAAGQTKPPHGAKGRGMVWLDYGTPEWDVYATDYREKRGVERYPENRIGGRGNWFHLLGEPASLPQRQRRRA